MICIVTPQLDIKVKLIKDIFQQGSIAYFSEAQKKLREERVISAKENEK